MITLGIDVGTTHTKVLALDVTTGRPLVIEAASTPVVEDGLGAAHRPPQVLETVIELTRRVVDRLPSAAQVRALCVASVGEEVVLLDQAGVPVGDAITWYDPRGLKEAGEFLAGSGGDLALSRRWPPDATFSLFKLLWIRDHAPEQLAAAATWTDLGDYVLHGLGGELVMDWSHASRAGAFDLLARAWDRASIDAAGLSIDPPRLVPSRLVIGSVSPAISARTGLPADVAVVTGGHDHLCAAYGAGVRSTSELFLSAGTSEAHLSLLDAPLEGEAAQAVDQGCYVDDRFYAHVNIHSGHFFQQWQRLLYEDVDEEAMYAQVAAASGADISFEVVDELRHGRLDHVPYDADRATIMRAVLEGLARRSAGFVDQLEAASGSPCELILVAGHPTRVPLWRRLRTRVYGRALAAVEEPEIAAFGAAVMAAHGIDAPGAADLVATRTTWTTSDRRPVEE